MSKVGSICGDDAMTDPVTIGTLAASALAMAGDETVKSFVGEAVKDAYKKLKDKIAHWAGADVDALEKAPASTARRGVVAEAVDGQSPEEQASVKALTDALVAALKSEAGKSGPVGIDAGKLEDLEAHLGKVTATQGTGVRISEARGGRLDIDEINVGPSPGKTDR
jgi:hypothetical protein